MRKIYQYILMAVALVATASCSNELDEALQPAGNGNLQFVVSDFPAFGEGGQTRAIGLEDAGKSAWADGDKILVHLYSQEYGNQAVELTFRNGDWNSDGGTLSYLENETPTITAVYAPDCEISENKIVIKEGNEYGMAEYIRANTNIENGTLYISFKGVERNYSRLRIAATENKNVTVTTTGFTPAGPNGTTAPESYTLTADDKGNAYLYGTFAANGTVNAETSNDVTKNYIFESETESGKSYVLDASLGYFYDSQTNTYTVWNANGLSAWGDAARNNPSTNLILDADITMPTMEENESNWKIVGTGSKQYSGTIDGNYHTISNLQMNYTSNNWISFAGYVDAQSMVKNLTFANVHISGQQYTGVVAGVSKGTITNCHVTSGIVTGKNNMTAGIVGSAGGTVTGCTNAASVNGGSVAGGIAGNTDGGVDGSPVVAACSNTGVVSATGSSVGGIVGGYSGNSVIGCWTVDTNEKDSNGAVTTGKNGIGSENSNSITHCYSGDAATINGKVEDMNTALGTTYGYQWQVGTDSYPTLVKITE